jgi:sugar lactone lactonase YvrE
MNPIETAKPKRALRILRVLAAVAGFVSAIGAPGAYAQNAAQQAALAQMSRARSNVHSYTSSGVEATNVALDQPGGLAFDTAGNLYIADTDNNIIREVNLAGVISTVAGGREQGFGGDGGLATAALLDSPVGVAVDSAGNIYIGDTHNNRVREVLASSGNIVTIAGTGVAGFSGDGGAATAALLNLPTAVAVDSNGNVYIADTNNNRIREIGGTTINTVAGNGQQVYSGDGGPATAAGLDSPDGVAVDAAFNIYIGDTHNQRVRLVTFTTGIITTLAGTGVKGIGEAGASAGCCGGCVGQRLSGRQRQQLGPHHQRRHGDHHCGQRHPRLYRRHRCFHQRIARHAARGSRSRNLGRIFRHAEQYRSSSERRHTQRHCRPDTPAN